MTRVYKEIHHVSHDNVADHAASAIERVIYFITGVILTLLTFRFLFSMLGANRGNGFANFIYSSSEPLVRPFFGLFGYSPQFGAARFEFETLIAMFFYGAIALGIASLVSMGRRDDY